MNALIEGFPLLWQQDIIHKCNVTLSYWISSDCYNWERKIEGCVYHDSMDAIQGREFFERSHDLGKIELYKKNSYYESNVELIDTVIRILQLRKYQYSKTNNKFYKDINSLRRFVCSEIAYWDYVLEKSNIDVVILESMPHLHYHYIIYYLAKMKGVNVIFFHRASDGIEMRYYLCSSMDELTPVHANSKKTDIKLTPVRDYGIPTYAVYDSDNPWDQKIYFSKIFKQSLKLFISPKDFFGGFYSRVKKLFELIKISVFRELNKIEYRLYSSKNIPIGDFIYFPLFVRPEDSSFPVGGNFEDPIYCIEYLLDKLDCLDKEFTLVVKEHPNQRCLDGNMYHGFYKDLIKLGKVVLLDQDVSSSKIIESCKCVVTVTGQTGWEALLKNKPVIRFSHPWYEKCNYVYHVDDLDSLFLFFKSNDFDASHVDDFYNSYLNSTYPGAVNLVIIHAVDITMEENVTTAANAINARISSWKGSLN
jgi:hypothetical protein